MAHWESPSSRLLLPPSSLPHFFLHFNPSKPPRHSFPSERSSDWQQVFFLPMQIIRGSPKVDGKEVVEHAWLTKEEIRDVVSEDYWDAVEGMLSDL